MKEKKFYWILGWKNYAGHWQYCKLTRFDSVMEYILLNGGYYKQFSIKRVEV